MPESFIISPIADIYGTPDTQALRGKFESQLVFGESFTVHEIKNGWAQGVCTHDGYPGYVEIKHLANTVTAPTHIVTAARSFVYRDATMKSPLQYTLSFGSRVTTGAADNGYTQLADGNWIYTKHLSAIGEKNDDAAIYAQRFLEVPYFWGGRSGFGIDCSGLMQVIMAHSGIALPRDTEDQVNIGVEKSIAGRGDLVFFPGHVGIMVDNDILLHANAFHMKVTQEPLRVVEERSKGITMIRGF